MGAMKRLLETMLMPDDDMRPIDCGCATEFFLGPNYRI